MRILVHDFSGHPFQVQLSRWLAGQGHQVRHLYSADFETPHGALTRRPEDPEGFSVEAVSLGRAIDKTSLARRARDEWAYGGRLARAVQAQRPEVMLSGNGSPLVHWRAGAAAARAGAAYVYWLQDIYSLALAHHLGQRGGLGRLAALPLALLRWIEFTTLKRAQAAVAISGDFRDILAEEGVVLDQLAVIENWAPAGEIEARPKDNPWARAQGLADKFVFLYSGTLGMKHDPELLAALAEAFRDDPGVRVAVISQGAGRQWLEGEKARRRLDNLLLLDFQPFEALSDALGAGDVHLVLLEPFAGRLSVPSKTLSCLAAERPVLSAMPPDNLAARLLAESGAGVNLPPGDRDGFLAAARELRDGEDARACMSAAARAYKQEHFDIAKIGPRFLAVFEEALKKQSS